MDFPRRIEVSRRYSLGACEISNENENENEKRRGEEEDRVGGMRVAW